MGHKASSLGTTVHSVGMNLGLNNERPVTSTTWQTCHFQIWCGFDRASSL